MTQLEGLDLFKISLPSKIKLSKQDTFRD